MLWLPAMAVLWTILLLTLRISVLLPVGARLVSTRWMPPLHSLDVRVFTCDGKLAQLTTAMLPLAMTPLLGIARL